MVETKSDKIIWYLMVTAISILIAAASGWAYSINDKVEKIVTLEANVQSIQTDISSIKNLIISEIKRGN